MKFPTFNNMGDIIKVSLCIFMAAFMSCKRKSFEENSNSILQYYTVEEPDSLKLKSATFLLENVSNHKHLDPESMESNADFFSFLESLGRRYEFDRDGKLVMGKIKFPDEEYQKGLDSIMRCKGTAQIYSSPLYIPDSSSLTKEFIISNINESYWAWRTFPWAKNVSFDVFKEYILPYRVIDTYWEKARPYFIYKYAGFMRTHKDKSLTEIADLVKDDIHLWFKEDGELTKRWPFIVPMSFRNIIKGRLGNCYEATALRITAMRAIGIPVAFELIPHWGNVNSSHFFYKVLDGKVLEYRELIDNKNIFRDTRSIVDGSSYVTKIDAFPSSMQVVFNKTIPKIYRSCFSKQDNSLAMQKTTADVIPRFFENERIMDVTKEYLDVSDVRIQLENAKGNKYAYLCVFDVQGWVPIAWAKIDNNIAIFKDMGKNIVYLPAFFSENRIIPASSPILVTSQGHIKKLNPSNQCVTMALDRKFRVSSHNFSNAQECVGARFQGSNNLVNGDSSILFTLKNIALKMTEIKIHSQKKYRYITFEFSDLAKGSVAELEFWGIRNGEEQKLNGKLIGNSGEYGREISRAFDGKRDTYFSRVQRQETFIGMDLGTKGATRLTKIRYCPRSDTNDILPDEIYELLYFDDKWKSLGKRVGKDFKSLIFKGPKGALFWLRNRSKGVEERIFTYENSKQIFW